jgi:hypothetical protein
MHHPRLYHATKLFQCGHLEIAGQDAEQESRHSGVERAVGELQVRHVHLIEMPGLRHGGTTNTCPFEHGRADVDTRDVGTERVVGAIPTGADPRIEKPTAEVLEYQGP